ncbi:GntR family transcriptional regulator [Salinicoccus hispanicus]|uniref:GntR family transcriptional regulator n=1 Tax=Salinicoccus hispanicus TaxID=157225 RepID=A0A6N8TW78_9STAP|nr:GntR family transcriptional regulator [Salinicoccus hispanicus]MXQ50178.1 GntR family transcriptional regulator [Salinicoccus hispanicus]
MNIRISNQSDIPIYEQLKREIIRLIMNGELRPGDPLLSMRSLAKELSISIITTKRAYQDLEASGYVYSVVGKGTFVSEQNAENRREQILVEIEKKIEDLLKTSKQVDLSVEELAEMMKVMEDEHI